MADVIELANHRPPPNPDNGAREALIAALMVAPTPEGENGIAVLCDFLLGHLWLGGFQIVALTGDSSHD